MPEYTYADVIIDPEDPRVEIGAEYYYGICPTSTINWANKRGRGDVLIAVEKKAMDPFIFSKNPEVVSACIIRKKEPEKRYIPFDLSKPEARNSLRGKFLIQLHVGNFAPEEKLVVGFSENSAVIGGYEPGCYDGHELLENFTFLDGTPCGQKEEE